MLVATQTSTSGYSGTGGRVLSRSFSSLRAHAECSRQQWYCAYQAKVGSECVHLVLHRPEAHPHTANSSPTRQLLSIPLLSPRIHADFSRSRIAPRRMVNTVQLVISPLGRTYSLVINPLGRTSQRQSHDSCKHSPTRHLSGDLEDSERDIFR